MAGAHAAVPAGPASPAFLPPSPSLPAPARIAMGGSWAPATPHPSVPDDAGGPGAFGARASREPNPPMCPLRGEGQGPRGRPQATLSPVHLRPTASWGTRSGGARGSPPPSCTRLLADHKRKGKRTREARPGAVTGSYLRAPAGPDTRREGRFPFPARLRRAVPPSCGPQPRRDTSGTAGSLRSETSPHLHPAATGRFRRRGRPGRRGEEASIPTRTPWRGQGEGGVRRELSNRPKALKNKIKNLWGGSNLFPPESQAAGQAGEAGRGGEYANEQLAPGLESPPSWTSGPPRPAAGQETSHQD